ncbi:MAG: hypothetical protein H7Y03_06870 [Chitinophagaceae bacterium]|nr:hypothetical protein [Chitinophagaceae bacterium]
MRLILCIILITLPSLLWCQTNVAGSWYGKAEAVMNGNNNSYLTELVIRQKGNKVEGILGYYFRNGYRSIYVHGTYNTATRAFLIKNVPFTYFRAASIDGVDCKMDLYGTLRVSKIKSDIDALLVSNSFYKYTCPELRVIFTRDEKQENQDSVIKTGITRRLWQPQAEDMVVTVKENLVSATRINDSVNNTHEKPVITPGIIIQPAISGIDALIASFNKRTNIVSKEIIVESDSLRISFYDNGTIDDDSISVFVNKKPVLTGQGLTAEALNIYIELDSTLDVNEITMYAENLGKYPPNTALMIVNDGDKMNEVFLSSSLERNSTVRIVNRKRKKLTSN